MAPAVFGAGEPRSGSMIRLGRTVRVHGQQPDPPSGYPKFNRHSFLKRSDSGWPIIVPTDIAPCKATAAALARTGLTARKPRVISRRSAPWLPILDRADRPNT